MRIACLAALLLPSLTFAQAQAGANSGETPNLSGVWNVKGEQVSERKPRSCNSCPTRR